MYIGTYRILFRLNVTIRYLQCNLPKLIKHTKYSHLASASLSQLLRNWSIANLIWVTNRNNWMRKYKKMPFMTLHLPRRHIRLKSCGVGRSTEVMLQTSKFNTILAVGTTYDKLVCNSKNLRHLQVVYN